MEEPNYEIAGPRQRKVSTTDAIVNGVRKLSVNQLPGAHQHFAMVHLQTRMNPTEIEEAREGRASAHKNGGLTGRPPGDRAKTLSIPDGPQQPGQRHFHSNGYLNPVFDRSESIESVINMVEKDDVVYNLPSEDKGEAVRRKKISIGFDPIEAIPSAMNYDDLNRGRVRPTLGELIDGKIVVTENSDPVLPARARGELGWIKGVLIWSILNLWGVMLFLRMAWMNAQAGMGLFLVIVLIGTVIAVLTSLSTSAISTNGEIGNGGTYFMISRSLGPEFGTAIGIIFTLANVVNVSLNLQGFAETVVDLLQENHLGMIDRANDMRIVGVLALVALTLFTFCGMELASKLQMVFFAILLAAIVNIVVGSFLPATLQQAADGFVGYSADNFKTNFAPAFQKGESFMSVFGVFFPSVTGILAGTSITGDLRDPSGAIPKGTIIAIAFTSISYILVGWITVSVTQRHASGSIEDLLLGNLTDCAAALTCAKGSINDYHIMEVVAHFRWVLIAGIFAATLSTSLGCIVFAPKIFQAVCRDKILPYIPFFGKGYGKGDEPYRAYGLGTIIAVAFLMPSDLNFISAIVSNFFLLTYALVNYATFNASYSESPGWRPTFRYYNKWLSLFTGAACVVLMFFLHWISAIISIGLIFVVFIIVYHRKPTANWGTSGQANIFRSALNDALRLLRVEDHVKNYRCQILVLSGLPCIRPGLVNFAHSIMRTTGMLICGHVLVQNETPEARRTVAQETYKWLRRMHIRAFYDSVTARSFADGAKALIQMSGLGKMKPNVLLMGYSNGWATASEMSNEEYVSVITTAFDHRLSVMILYAKEGFDVSDALNFDQLVVNNSITRVNSGNDIDLSGRSDDGVTGNIAPLEVKDSLRPEMKARVAFAERLRPGRGHRFENGKLVGDDKIVGEIHVWWLYDDGGLSLLVPYLLTRTSPWNGCKLKIFCLDGKPKDGETGNTQQSMKALLDKFRIQADEVTAVDLDTPPSEESIKWFNNLIEKFRSDSANDKAKYHNGQEVIRDFDLLDLKEKTLRHIRLRELLQQHSSNSSLNVVTMPLPRKNRSSTLYMATLELMVAGGMPTTLLIRGAHENVLTYYC
ncbi:Solute carrier family 12 member 2 [Hypsibius exemplaris]|uniref:Solute carrier family 12 member 3 n=1 Tax=Hypsibius exemplaris TaxID=2072580 RepID=A0A9X6N8V1_HYPEX|nr:Solute carrier family 12 member 2 [Hypsibius exemplaris]